MKKARSQQDAAAMQQTLGRAIKYRRTAEVRRDNKNGAPVNLSTSMALSGKLALSSNWEAFQKVKAAKHKLEEHEQDHQQETILFRSKKSKKEHNNMRKIVKSSSKVNKNSIKPTLQNGKRENLLAWAEDNDIPLEDLKKAYGDELRSDEHENSSGLYLEMKSEDVSRNNNAGRPIVIDESKYAILRICIKDIVQELTCAV